MRSLLLTLAILLTEVAPLCAQLGTTLHVPGDQPTIQAALDVAGAGSEILVAPGIYAEAIVFNGVAVSLRSSGGAAVTTIDGTGRSQSVVSVVSGEPAGTLVQGFTITGGDAPTGGGGVHVTGSSTFELRECVIRGNQAEGQGGGVHAGPTDSVLVADCALVGNVTAASGGGAFGGASLALERCAVIGNHALGGGGLSGGVASDCVIADNTATFSGGGATGSDLLRCLVEGNSAGTDGGGVLLVKAVDFGQDVVLRDCLVRDNSAGGQGGGAWLSEHSSFIGATDLTVERCLFANNSAPVGDGVYAEAVEGIVPPGGGYVAFEQCTLVDDAVFVDADSFRVRGCIVRDNAAPFSLTPAPLVTFSDVEGGWPGPGNFDADPLFLSQGVGGFGLAPGSPCIDSGSPAHPLDPDGSPPDMGALAFATSHGVGAPLYGSRGLPDLEVLGVVSGGAALSLVFSRGPSGGAGLLVLAVAPLGAALKGGVLVPQALFVIPGLALDALGSLTLPASWPSGVPSGAQAWMQGWFPDAAGPVGFSSTQGVVLVQP